MYAINISVAKTTKSSKKETKMHNLNRPHGILLPETQEPKPRKEVRKVAKRKALKRNLIIAGSVTAAAGVAAAAVVLTRNPALAAQGVAAVKAAAAPVIAKVSQETVKTGLVAGAKSFGTLAAMETGVVSTLGGMAYAATADDHKVKAFAIGAGKGAVEGAKMAFTTPLNYVVAAGAGTAAAGALTAARVIVGSGFAYSAADIIYELVSNDPHKHGVIGGAARGIKRGAVKTAADVRFSYEAFMADRKRQSIVDNGTKIVKDLYARAAWDVEIRNDDVYSDDTVYGVYANHLAVEEAQFNALNDIFVAPVITSDEDEFIAKSLSDALVTSGDIRDAVAADISVLAVRWANMNYDSLNLNPRQMSDFVYTLFANADMDEYAEIASSVVFGIASTLDTADKTAGR